MIYNVEKQLDRCIQSILHQTYRNLEIILVDDGSPDNCPQMCDDYAKCDSRIKVIHKKNGGLVSARNAGYEAATGIWQMYLDGDDWIDGNTCEELMKTVSRYPDVDILFWNCIQELGEKSIKGKWEWSCPDNAYETLPAGHRSALPELHYAWTAAPCEHPHG